MTVYDLAAARSTWNGTDLSSREILAPWAHPGDLARAMPSDFSSFAPSHLAILQRAARPRAGLYEKAVAAYSEPAVPEPTEWTFQGVEESLKNNAPGRNGLVPGRYGRVAENRRRIRTGRGLERRPRADLQDRRRTVAGRPRRVPARSPAAGIPIRPGARGRDQALIALPR